MNMTRCDIARRQLTGQPASAPRDKKVAVSTTDRYVRWFKSSASGATNCVEVALLGDEILMRDSKAPDTAVLHFGCAEWKAFLAGVRGGEFDR